MSGAVLVFGASGFVGRNLVERLTGDGREVFAVTGSGAPVPGARQTVALASVADIGALPGDIVACHVAAYRYDAGRFDLAQSDILLNNNDLTGRILHFCAERKIAELRMASSVAVYEAGLSVMDDARPIDLNAPPFESEAFYAWSKRYAEISAGLYAKRFGVNAVILRLSNPYGPHDSTNPDKAHVAPAFVMKALDANPVFPIRGDPGVERDFTYVGDVAEVFSRTLAWRGRSETFNVCRGETSTLTELAETVMRVAGVDKPIEAGAPGAFGPAKRISTSERVRKELGLSFRTLEDGMKPTIDWYRHAFAR
ncbi:MAG: NAD-dependent epimerase/dehydratase [Alphaproteobacteria bacterium]|nr:MAG: NAD-dependent epimerase/dehydratase [Caulobacteraceae bacterium]TPW08121.1 MAG: NAD-dependent epimerase/dehydratase [Alphaproteobacteria bacterium]